MPESRYIGPFSPQNLNFAKVILASIMYAVNSLNGRKIDPSKLKK